MFPCEGLERVGDCTKRASRLLLPAQQAPTGLPSLGPCFASVLQPSRPHCRALGQGGTWPRRWEAWGRTGGLPQPLCSRPGLLSRARLSLPSAAGSGHVLGARPEQQQGRREGAGGLQPGRGGLRACIAGGPLGPGFLRQGEAPPGAEPPAPSPGPWHEGDGHSPPAAPRGCGALAGTAPAAPWGAEELQPSCASSSLPLPLPPGSGDPLRGIW